MSVQLLVQWSANLLLSLLEASSTFPIEATGCVQDPYDFNGTTTAGAGAGSIDERNSISCLSSAITSSANLLSDRKDAICLREYEVTSFSVRLFDDVTDSIASGKAMAQRRVSATV